jgi:hypothetical protein
MMSVFNNDVHTGAYTDLHRMEKLWAKELYELRVEDRETINDELHGASVPRMHASPEERWTEQQYLLYLNQFQIEIDTKILLADKKSYLKGIELGSSYIMSPEYRLKFLRAERYDVEKAAIRYCKCLDFLLEFFGKDALLRPLTMSHLTKNEKKFLRDGYCQVLPTRDRLGRRILAQLGSYGGTEYTEMEKFRVCTYLCFSVLSVDVTTQHLGVVSVASFTLGAEAFMRKELRECSRFIKRFFAAVPLRWSAAHLCIPDDPIYHVLKSLCLFLLGVKGRSMLRIHVGTPIECDYKLRSFGIPTDDIPRTHTHTIKLKNHNKLLKIRKSRDEFIQEAKINKITDIRFLGIECPEINCVLFGRYAWDHPGNVEFRGLLRDVTLANKDRNLEIPDQLHLMIKNVIEESRIQKFRFLMYDRETFLYEEVTDYGKIWGLVEQSVREHRKRSRAKRMIDETKDAKSSDEEVPKVSASSSIGRQSYSGGKFMKDCNGCRWFISE